jgi:hypothetical protein
MRLSARLAPRQLTVCASDREMQRKRYIDATLVHKWPQLVPAKRSEVDLRVNIFVDLANDSSARGNTLITGVNMH